MATASEKRKPGRPQTYERTPLGKRIERYAANRHMTARDVAQAAGISHVTLYGMMNGTTPDPRVSTLRAVADALGVSLDRLWPRAG